jgi:hypothetical protein
MAERLDAAARVLRRMLVDMAEVVAVASSGAAPAGDRLASAVYGAITTAAPTTWWPTTGSTRSG